MALAKANRPYGKINKGQTIPYGTMVGASKELRETYYLYGYKDDSMFPELPCLPYEEEPTTDPEEELHKVELAEYIQEMLDSLTPREAKVLRMRFGIQMDCDYTLEEVGKRFDVTRERIRQIEARFIRLLGEAYWEGIESKLSVLSDFSKTVSLMTEMQQTTLHADDNH